MQGLSLGLASRIFVTKREVVLGDAIFTVRLVMKQFTEAERVVFVWNAVADWLNVGSTRSASTREHGWCSIKPAVCPGMSSTQSFVLVTPTTSATGSNRSGVIENTIRLYLRNSQLVIGTVAAMDDDRDACSPRLHDALAAFLAHADGDSACVPPSSTSLLSLLGLQTGGEVDGKHHDADAASSPDDAKCETSSTIPLGKPQEAAARVCFAGKGLKKKAKKRRRDRNRPQHEIARLQSQASELECELQKLLATCDDRARCSLRPHTENIQLKKKLRRNLERTARVEQLLNSQTDQLLQPTSGSLVVSSRNLVYDAEQDASVFQMQAQAVDAHYREMDRVLAVAGLLGVTSEGLMLGSASRIVVQKREVTLGDTACTVRLVLKQFIEKDRFVHVWDTVGEWPQMGTASRVSTRDHGWGFIQRMEDTGVSLCQSCVLMTPTTEDEESSESSTAIDAVTRLYQSMILSQHQFLENKLMDQALGVRKEKPAVA
ncbi:hypothetical protein BBJ28_00016519 [Nothophytophthora sp. Chile5]|nr:hypothetical protein BBJ28_00016519 [Nothophytophthora sp. Chile5]